MSSNPSMISDNEERKEEEEKKCPPPGAGQICHSSAPTPQDFLQVVDGDDDDDENIMNNNCYPSYQDLNREPTVMLCDIKYPRRATDNDMKFGHKKRILIAMCYGNPSLRDVMERFQKLKPYTNKEKGLLPAKNNLVQEMRRRLHILKEDKKPIYNDKNERVKKMPVPTKDIKQLESWLMNERNHICNEEDNMFLRRGLLATVELMERARDEEKRFGYALYRAR